MEYNKGVVSVITPVYNGEKYIDQYINTLLAQTYNRVELIIINDGSTDSTAEKLQTQLPLLEKKGWTIKFSSQKNQGAAGAVNNALKHATGEFLMLFDIDDILAPTNIEAKAHYLHTHPQYGMVRHNGYMVFLQTEKSILFSRNPKEKLNEHICEDILCARTNNWPGSFMVRSQVLFDNLTDREIYTSQYGQNMQIMLPVAFHSRAGYIDEPLMQYMVYPSSHSHGGDTSRKWELRCGYKQNRIEIIRRMNIPESQKLDFYDQVERTYALSECDFWLSVLDIKRAKETYRFIKSNSLGTIGLKTKLKLYLFPLFKIYRWIRYR